MNLKDFLKQLSIQDALILNMLENGHSAMYIATELGVSHQTVYNTKKRFEPVKEALNAAEGKYMDIVTKPTRERRDDKIA